MAGKEAQIYKNKGWALYSQKKYDEAEENYTRAIQLDPAFLDAYNERGLVYNGKREYDKAIEDYNSAIRINSRVPYVYNNLGNVYLDKGEYEKAIESYTAAIKLDKKFVDAYNGRGNTYSTIGKFSRALADYNEAIIIMPDYALPHENRGLVYMDLGKYDEAIKDFTKVISINPDKPSTYVNRGNAYRNKGSEALAIADFTEAIRLRPDYTEAYNNRGNSYLGVNNDRAILEYSEAIKIDENYSIGYDNRGLAYFNKYEYDKALAEYNQALKINPKDEWTYFIRGDVFLKRGELDSAIDDFSMALKLNPKYSAAKEKRDEVYSLKGENTASFESGSTKGTTYRRYKKKLDTLGFTGEIKETTERELQKLRQVYDNDSPFDPSNFAGALNYLETLLALPWNDPEPEQFSIKRAMEILEEDHYGLADVKSRIIEFLAVRKMKKDTKGAILCLDGPPGVGKTSMGRSIARALGKPFYRFSVGGVNDVSAIRGSRRMWIGAEPGRIIQGLKITKSKSSVIMIDEIDKITSRGGINGGDPSAALLEVLDPEQNNTFRDQYLDIPFDLSSIFFVVTSNDRSDLPAPLIDRMEIIEIPGYVDEEKLKIAKKYLIPKSLEKNGLEKDQVTYTDEAILHVTNSFEREPGVRLLEQNLDKIHRKLVRQIIERKETENTEANKPVLVLEKQQVEKYLGKPRYRDDEIDMQKAERPGMAIGLAVQGSRGIPLLIEAVSVPGEEGYTITGNMKKVMEESVKTAFTFAQKYAIEHKYRDLSWFKENHVHLHIPTAAPKDGPSAGITIAVALLSLFRNKTAADKVVLTGEITLSGHVLAIGGLKEKIIGAKHNKAEHIIFPKQNLRDLDEIPDIVKAGIEFHPVERIEEVLALTLPESP